MLMMNMTFMTSLPVTR